MKNWNHLEEAFAQLNRECSYLILRNFEGFFETLLWKEHEDIDILCASKKDRNIMIHILDAKPRLGKDNGIHYKFTYRGKEIPLDIRTVGDGYYDRKWEKRMLESRFLFPSGFYTMNQENYYYSLIYHAVYQKEKVSEEYLERLRTMNPVMRAAEQTDFEKALLQFMNDHHYKYTIPYDSYVPARFRELPDAAWICYPAEVRLRHMAEKGWLYLSGKTNGAKLRLKRLIKRRKGQ